MNNSRIVTADMASYIQNRKNDVKAEMNCIGVGTIIAFDSSDQTVTVQLNYLRTIFNAVPVDSPASDESTSKRVPYPQLVKCPLMIPSGGLGYMTFPVAAGDQCVILFNDRDIDTWWTTGSPNSAPNSARLHDLNDALVFVGVRPQTNPILLYNMLGPEIGNGLAKLSVEDRIKISVAGVTLGTTIDLLMIQLIALANSVGDTPVATALAAIQVTFDEILK